MNVYDSIKLAAREGWMIDFDACHQEIKIVATLHGSVAQEHWQNEHGPVTPVTALIRAIRKAKVNTARLRQGYSENVREHAGAARPAAEVQA